MCFAVCRMMKSTCHIRRRVRVRVGVRVRMMKSTCHIRVRVRVWVGVTVGLG